MDLEIFFINEAEIEVWCLGKWNEIDYFVNWGISPISPICPHLALLLHSVCSHKLIAVYYEN